MSARPSNRRHQSFLCILARALPHHVATFAVHRLPPPPPVPVQFKMVDRDQSGMITFAEFAMFTHIMANPDPEFEIAFRYFDRLANGYVGCIPCRGRLVYRVGP